MTKKRIYHKTRADALTARSTGDRIYYDADEKEYYTVTPTKRDFWGLK